MVPILSYLNEVDRHYEQSELTEASLYDRAVHRPATVEESTLQSIEGDCLRLEVAMCFELSSESNTLSRTEKKTDMAIYYDAETGGFYIKLPPEAYLLSPLQLNPISLQEYLPMFDS